jgi:hypothetical protein
MTISELDMRSQNLVSDTEMLSESEEKQVSAILEFLAATAECPIPRVALKRVTQPNDNGIRESAVRIDRNTYIWFVGQRNVGEQDTWIHEATHILTLSQDSDVRITYQDSHSFFADAFSLKSKILFRGVDEASMRFNQKYDDRFWTTAYIEALGYYQGARYATQPLPEDTGIEQIFHLKAEQISKKRFTRQFKHLFNQLNPIDNLSAEQIDVLVSELQDLESYHRQTAYVEGKAIGKLLAFGGAHVKLADFLRVSGRNTFTSLSELANKLANEEITLDEFKVYCELLFA